jgi:hypothetical protein
MTDGAQNQHLQTKYVFVDAESFRRARFDWTGRALSKLVEFAKHGHVQLLITDVTIGEVQSQLREVLTEAVASMKKHEAVLQQIGALQDAKMEDDSGALALDAAFDKFLKDTKSINVPLSIDVGALVGDYFARRPPFSAKKKFEFPDAIVIASLLAWCAKRRTKAYVVSADPDLKACCSTPSSPLLYAASVADIISQANVSKELHDALENALKANERLNDELADEIKSMELVGSRGPWHMRAGDVSVSGKIDGVDEINILSVNVLDQEADKFTCEVEVEAGLYLELNVEVSGEYGHGDYKPPSFHNINRTVYDYFYAEVILKFDQKVPGEVEFQSIHVSGNSVELRPDQIEDRWFR